MGKRLRFIFTMFCTSARSLVISTEMFGPMSGKNRRLVADEPVEVGDLGSFERNL